jgi:putative PIN family toxin of toxin-antitoxin system
MAKHRVVLDSNVVLAGLYSSRGASYRILEAVERGTLGIVLSTALLFEYEDILKRHQVLLGVSDERIEEILDALCARSEHQRIYFLWRPQLSDPKDDHILELAVAAGVGAIVTHNVRHFDRASAFGVRAVTPRQWLEELK